MPGLFVFRPVSGLKVEKVKAPAGGRKVEKAPAERVSVSRLRSMGAKVLPLPLEEVHEAADKPAPAAAAGGSSFPSQHRAKQVSDPIAESVKAKICDSRLFGGHQPPVGSNGSSSSGSEHEPNSVCLAAMVNEFMEDEEELNRCGRARCNCENGACNGYGCCGSDAEEEDCNIGELPKILQGLVRCASGTERKLLSDVVATVKEAWDDVDTVCNAELGDCSRACLRRAVMTRLRALGHNAAICKSRWDHSRGFPGGDYEYLDVTISSTGKERYLIDLDFRGQFQIARPTQQYNAALQTIPAVFVGRAERLQQIVDVMTEATKRSLKRRGMHLPPWRKAEYMRAKWLAPYKRTTNEVLSGHADKCRVQSAVLGGAALRVPPKTAVASKIATTGSTAACNEEAEPIVLELELEEKVDAVIYLGKVFSVAENINSVARGQGYVEAMGRGSPKASAAINQGLPGQAAALEVRGGAPERASVREARVMNSEWQPPSVKPRTSRAGQVKAGLAMVLKEAGLSRQPKKVADEQTQLRLAMASAS